jgi:hypothetical protein
VIFVIVIFLHIIEFVDKKLREGHFLYKELQKLAPGLVWEREAEETPRTSTFLSNFISIHNEIFPPLNNVSSY